VKGSKFHGRVACEYITFSRADWDKDACEYMVGS
jgi:hypothetical protein